MKTNVRTPVGRTHEGAPIYSTPSPLIQLRRHVLACMLFEDTFYEDGVSSADRIKDLCKEVSFNDLAQLAVDAREKYKLRHVPLLLLVQAVKLHKGRQVGDLIHRVIQRPDELGEFLSIYWKYNVVPGKKRAPLAAQMKIGLARALKKFSPHTLAKYNGGTPSVKLRDVLFLSHAKPYDPTQEAIFKSLAEGNLATPDTWEVNLSAGADKKETFSRLITEKKLGALALLRNLRNMRESGVDRMIIVDAIHNMQTERVLPFRFITAARYAPEYAMHLESAMLRCLEVHEKMAGSTIVLVDVSGSMAATISSKSELTRMDAACGVAMLLREICEDVRIVAFSDRSTEVRADRGFALAENIVRSMPHGGTRLGDAVRLMPPCDRLIVLTDEQSHDVVPHPHGKGYMVNVAGYQPSVAYGPWVSVTGWSEAIISYIMELERLAAE